MVAPSAIAIGNAPKIALPVLLEEYDVPQLEFPSLLGIVAAPFGSVLTNPR